MSQGAMLQHVGKAHMEKNFECHKCLRKFATNVRLQIHIQETTSVENSYVSERGSERRISLLLQGNNFRTSKVSF
jgi:hypothetical protein